jgi:hypothetical protein
MAWQFSYFQTQGRCRGVGQFLNVEMPLGRQSASHSLSTTARGPPVVATGSLGEKALSCKSRGLSSCCNHSKPPRQGLGLTLPTHLYLRASTCRRAGWLECHSKTPIITPALLLCDKPPVSSPGIPAAPSLPEEACLRYAFHSPNQAWTSPSVITSAATLPKEVGQEPVER